MLRAMKVQHFHTGEFLLGLTSYVHTAVNCALTWSSQPPRNRNRGQARCQGQAPMPPSQGASVAEGAEIPKEAAGEVGGLGGPPPGVGGQLPHNAHPDVSCFLELSDGLS